MFVRDVLDGTEPSRPRHDAAKKPQPGLPAEAFGVDGVRLNSSSRVTPRTRLG